MIRRTKISLNRILFPVASLEDFFKITSDMGLNKVELRNDLPQIGIIDPYSFEQVKGLSEKYDIQILTINALQKFNLGAVLPKVLEELKELIKLAVSIDCGAIVLVPNNDVDDKRGSEVMMKETVTALKAFGPLLEDSGILGYVEPLGFKQCSLRSKVTAIKAIQESGCRNYKIVHDTFHHHLGPDTNDIFKTNYNIFYTGLVHVSGVESDLPAHQYKDDHRVLISDRDHLKNLEQLELLLKLGYNGDISFEPFATEVQTMDIEALKAAIHQSIDFMINR
ncbi:MAG: TIM barrel protein [Desulfobacterales bacterium]|nr:MAG: TIM barrel protein [Desulfobacterales bacterium]